MIFSKRTDWNTSQNNLSAILDFLKKSGTSVCDLTVSNPTRCEISYPGNVLLDAFSDKRNLIYDPDPRGLRDARRAVIDYYAAQAVNLSEDQVFITASTSEAYGFLFRLLGDPHDQVLFPKPSYPLFEFLSGLHDLSWNTYNLFYKKRWEIDRELFEQAIKERPRAVILVNPNNPTGSCLSNEELDFIYSRAMINQAPVICDEVFLDYCYDERRPFKTLAGKKEHLTFVLGGLSKTLALPQMKCSWIIVNGPDKEVFEAVSRLEIIADTYLSVNTPVQHALPGWMKLRGEIQSNILMRIRENRRYLSWMIDEKKSTTRLLSADGGWSAVVKCPVADEEDFVTRLLKEKHVLIHPGYFFDFDADGFFVISLLAEEKCFQEGVNRFLESL